MCHVYITTRNLTGSNDCRWVTKKVNPNDCLVQPFTQNVNEEKPKLHLLHRASTQNPPPREAEAASPPTSILQSGIKSLESSFQPSKLACRSKWCKAQLMPLPIIVNINKQHIRAPNTKFHKFLFKILNQN